MTSKWMSLLLAACVAFWAVGCAQPTEYAGDDHDHDHADDHDHAHDDHDHDDDHGHHHSAPHGGTLIELGDHVGHAELLIDDEGKITLYLLDGEAEAPIRTTQETITIEMTPEGGDPIVVDLAAMENVLTSETIGDTSQFGGMSEELAGVERAMGKILSIDFRGMQYENVEINYPEGE